MLTLDKRNPIFMMSDSGAREVRDTSLRAPHGGDGIVLDVKIFNREDGDELPPGVNQLVRVYINQRRRKWS